MYIITASSTKEDYKEAVFEIVEEIEKKKFEPKLILYFLSMKYPQDKIAVEIKSNFNCDCVGMTSAGGEYCDDKFYEHSLTAMCFSDKVFEEYDIVNLNLAEDMDIASVRRRVVAGYFNEDAMRQDSKKYFAVTLLDISNPQYTDKADRLIEYFASYFNITALGGLSAPASFLDDSNNCIHINGQTYKNYIGLIFFKAFNDIDIISTHNQLPTNKILTPTAFGENNRIVKEFNHMPAIDAFSQAIGIDKDKIDNDVFQEFSLAFEPDSNRFFTVQTKRSLPDGSLEYYAKIHSYVDYNVMYSSDMWFETKKAINLKLQKDIEEERLDKMIGVVEFNCLSRTNMLNKNNDMDRLVKLFDFAPHIGLSTSGELYMGVMSYTSVLLFLYK